MKYRLLLALLLPLGVFGQSDSLLRIFPYSDGIIRYERIVQADTTSRQELYRRAKLWALDVFRSQKDALQTDDKDLGVLAYDTYVGVPYYVRVGGQSASSVWRYWFTLQVQFKDGRARIVAEKLRISSTSDPQHYNLAPTIEAYDKMKESKLKRQSVELSAANYHAADNMIKELIKSLETALLTNPKDDW